MKLKPIKEQVVAVVGASSGIGRETALRLARRDQVQAIAERAVERFGRIESWVHCASVALYAPVEERSAEEFQRVIQINLLGQVHGVRAALPILRREGRGALIHVSSIAGRVSLPLLSAYSAAKHGAHGFLDALRVELAQQGSKIQVTEILPASINTPFFNKAHTKLGALPASIPPMYSPGSVAEAILYAAEHPKAVDAPNNLFAPIQGYDHVQGDYGRIVFPSIAPSLKAHSRLIGLGTVFAMGMMTLWLNTRVRG